MTGRTPRAFRLDDLASAPRGTLSPPLGGLIVYRALRPLQTQQPAAAGRSARRGSGVLRMWLRVLLEEVGPVAAIFAAAECFSASASASRPSTARVSPCI